MKLSSIFSFIAAIGLAVAAPPQIHIKATTVTRGTHTVTRTRTPSHKPTVTVTRTRTPTRSPTPTPTSDVIQGFDISHHNFGKVNLAAAYNSGARFVYCKATEGTHFIDKRFQGFTTEAAALGLYHGAYHFAQPSKGTGAAQAKYFLAHGGNPTSDGKTLISFLDIEANPKDVSGPGMCYNLGKQDMVQFITDFVNTYQAATGRYPMIYTSPSFWTQCTGNSQAFADTSPLMLARYRKTPGTPPGGWPKLTIWQNSEHYPFGGDSDKLYGGMAALNGLLQ